MESMKITIHNIRNYDQIELATRKSQSHSINTKNIEVKNRFFWMSSISGIFTERNN